MKAIRNNGQKNFSSFSCYLHCKYFNSFLRAFTNFCLFFFYLSQIIFIARTQNTQETDFAKLYEKYRDITIEKLTPSQLSIFTSIAVEVDVSIDDVIFFVKTYAKRISKLIKSKSSFSTYATQVSLLKIISLKGFY